MIPVWLAALVSVGCASKGTLNFRLDESFSADQVAIIRPATKEEKKEPKPGLAVRIFVNPGGPALATLTYISSPGVTDRIDLRGYDAVRVRPGVYEIGASCWLNPYMRRFAATVHVGPGKEYLIECLGNTAHMLKLTVFER